eukprot:Gb_12980 [translate_table: standard]
MGRKEIISMPVFAMILALLLADAAIALPLKLQNSEDNILAEPSSLHHPYPEGCIRKEPCPADTGADCESYRIPVLPCSCSEVESCDPTARGCTESTIAGPRPCNF